MRRRPASTAAIAPVLQAKGGPCGLEPCAAGELAKPLLTKISLPLQQPGNAASHFTANITPPCTLVLQLLKALWCVRKVQACQASLPYIRYLLKHAALPVLPDKVGIAITESVSLGTSAEVVE